jgi:S-formylglutathione hydrolase FrmB
MKRVVCALAVLLWWALVPGRAATTLDFTMYSNIMHRTISYSIAVPAVHFSQTTRRFPVLYAMHGLGAPYATMTGMNATQNAIDATPMYVVTFNGDYASWYLDSPLIDSSQFTTFFFDEFILKIDSVWRTRTDGKFRAATGFSMGGFGAVHYMLCRPDMFSSVSSMSGAFYAMGELGKAPNSTVTTLLGSKATYPQRYRHFYAAGHGPGAQHAPAAGVPGLRHRGRASVRQPQSARYAPAHGPRGAGS